MTHTNICMTWLIRTYRRYMTHTYICMTWLIHTCITYMTWRILTWARGEPRRPLSSNHTWNASYEVATISRLPKNIGLFCKRALWKRLHSAKETSILRSLLIIATSYLNICIWHDSFEHIYNIHDMTHTIMSARRATTTIADNYVT